MCTRSRRHNPHRDRSCVPRLFDYEHGGSDRKVGSARRCFLRAEEGCRFNGHTLLRTGVSGDGPGGSGNPLDGSSHGHGPGGAHASLSRSRQGRCPLRRRDERRSVASFGDRRADTPRGEPGDQHDGECGCGDAHCDSVSSKIRGGCRCRAPLRGVGRRRSVGRRLKIERLSFGQRLVLVKRLFTGFWIFRGDVLRCDHCATQSPQRWPEVRAVFEPGKGARRLPQRSVTGHAYTCPSDPLGLEFCAFARPHVRKRRLLGFPQRGFLSGRRPPSTTSRLAALGASGQDKHSAGSARDRGDRAGFRIPAFCSRERDAGGDDSGVPGLGNPAP